MANKKITQLPDLSAITADAEAVIVQAGTTYKYKPALPLNARAFGASPSASGAVNKAAILAAVNAGIAAGVPVTGGGLTYGISGTLELPSNAHLQDITLKQLTPGVTDVRTLLGNGDNLTLIRVKVDRNGDGTGNSFNGAGIWISGGSGHYLERIEVFGDDLGNGIVINAATDFRLVRPYVHDLNYLLGANPLDDRINGLYLTGCSRFSVSKPYVKSLGGDYGSGATTRWTRGFVVSGCHQFIIDSPYVDTVDQGVDFTGSVISTQFEIHGGLVRTAYSFGWKFAGAARSGSIVNAVAIDCGLTGFVNAGPSESAAAIGELSFVNCTAYDTGSNGNWPASDTAGFSVTRVGAGDSVFLEGVRFLNCRAIDRQGSPTMRYGFFCDVDAPTNGRYNEMVGCVSIGHTIAPSIGMNASRCSVSRIAVQSIPDNAWTLIDWDADVDLGSMHDTASNNSLVFARRKGYYRMTFTATFAANATGVRGIRAETTSGAVVPGSTVLVSAANAGETSLNYSFSLELTAGQDVRFSVFQTSGGALNLQTGSRGMLSQESLESG